MKFYAFLWKHTHIFCCSESVAIVVERRSSVASNHNASFCLSGSLGTYSNKCWLTHTDTYTHTRSDSLGNVGWGCFEVIRHKAIILIQSWENCWTFTTIFPQGSIIWKKKTIQQADTGVSLFALESGFVNKAAMMPFSTSSPVLPGQKNKVFEGFDNDSLAIFLYCVGQTSMKSELLSNFPLREITC